jgi:hypothetical protein
MNIQSILYAFFLLIIAVLSVAASSIGIQCYGDRTGESNYKFLVANLIMALLLLVCTIGSIAVAVYAPSY